MLKKVVSFQPFLPMRKHLGTKTTAIVWIQCLLFSTSLSAELPWCFSTWVITYVHCRSTLTLSYTSSYFLVWDKKSHLIIQTDLELYSPVWSWTCHPPASTPGSRIAGITGLCHQARLTLVFPVIIFKWYTLWHCRNGTLTSNYFYLKLN